MTNLNIQSCFWGKSFPLFVLVVPVITPSTLNPPVCLNRHAHLKNLDLANDFLSTDEISILIGVDQYHRFVSAEKECGSEGPVSTKSVFGRLVSGPVQTSKRRCFQVHFCCHRIQGQLMKLVTVLGYQIVRH